MSFLHSFSAIDTFVFDIDGVLTDGMVIPLPDGSMVRRMNIKDGYALQLAVKKGYRVIAISGAISDEVKLRLKKLGVQSVYMGIENKLQCLEVLVEKNQLSREKILFMGDDIPDIELMKYAGFACCPNDAVSEIKNLAHYISPLNGGMGCVREVIEKTMKIQGNWTNDTSVKSR